MSRFNKNGRNLSDDHQEQWLEANATKVVESKPEAEAEGEKKESKGRKGLSLRRNKKGEDNG